jgi:hypothetical protein
LLGKELASHEDVSLTVLCQIVREGAEIPFLSQGGQLHQHREIDAGDDLQSPGL